MHIQKIIPTQLPNELMFRLNHLYHAELGNFVVITDRQVKTLYVNRTIPQTDIEGFCEVIFSDYLVNDDELGKGIFLEHVFNQYGSAAYRALLDAHTWRMKQEETHKAQEAARHIIPLIEEELNSENPTIEYEERLIFEVWKYGLHLGKKTPNRISSCESMYVFYLGYLLGAGKWKGVLP